MLDCVKLIFIYLRSNSLCIRLVAVADIVETQLEVEDERLSWSSVFSPPNMLIDFFKSTCRSRSFCEGFEKVLTEIWVLQSLGDFIEDGVDSDPSGEPSISPLPLLPINVFFGRLVGSL